MSITLELTPQEEELVRSTASKFGQTPGSFVRETVLNSLHAFKPETTVEWDKWASVGTAATLAARADLRAHGISSVYQKDGVIVEELPDGTIQPLTVEKA